MSNLNIEEKLRAVLRAGPSATISNTHNRNSGGSDTIGWEKAVQLLPIKLNDLLKQAKGATVVSNDIESHVRAYLELAPEVSSYCYNNTSTTISYVLLA